MKIKWEFFYVEPLKNTAYLHFDQDLSEYDRIAICKVKGVEKFDFLVYRVVIRKGELFSWDSIKADIISVLKERVGEVEEVVDTPSIPKPQTVSGAGLRPRYLRSKKKYTS